MNQDEMKTVRYLKFSGKQEDWDEWSQTFLALARARDYAGVLLGKEEVPRADEVLDPANKAHEMKIMNRRANEQAYLALELSTEHLAFNLIMLAKTDDLPEGCAKTAWNNLKEEYDLSEGEDKIELLTSFQQNKLEDARINVTEWLTHLAIQVTKLSKLGHVLDEEYQVTHILASLPKEYSGVVEQAKIDQRAAGNQLDLKELKKRLKERHLQLKKDHGWKDDEMALSMKGNNKQGQTNNKLPRGKYFKGRCNHCGKWGHKKSDCWDLKNKKEGDQNKEKKDKSHIKCFYCGKMGHYESECQTKKRDKENGVERQPENQENFSMMCYKSNDDSEQRHIWYPGYGYGEHD